MLAQPINALFLSFAYIPCMHDKHSLVELAYVLSLLTNIIETSFLSRAFGIADLAQRALDDAIQGAPPSQQ
jgi:hypothetical protein